MLEDNVNANELQPNSINPVKSEVNQKPSTGPDHKLSELIPIQQMDEAAKIALNQELHSFKRMEALQDYRRDQAEKEYAAKPKVNIEVPATEQTVEIPIEDLRRQMSEEQANKNPFRKLLNTVRSLTK